MLLLELSGEEIHVAEFFLPIAGVRAEVFIVCHSLGQARADTVQNDIDQVVVCHLGIDIKSVNIVQVLLDSTCLFEISYLI